jgi:rSAM/selenodomain-associated transferase 1
VDGGTTRWRRFGERLDRAFTEAFGTGARRVVVIGSDCPEIASDDIEKAWAALREFDLVLGPATDGGYWLLGLRAPQPQLFRGIPWSSATVLNETLARARPTGLSVHLLRELSDIDTVEDWRTFLARNATSE